MNTETITIKVDRETKEKAQQIAKELGFSLSSIVKAYLRHLIKTKTVHFSALDQDKIL